MLGRGSAGQGEAVEGGERHYRIRRAMTAGRGSTVLGETSQQGEGQYRDRTNVNKRGF